MKMAKYVFRRRFNNCYAGAMTCVERNRAVNNEYRAICKELGPLSNHNARLRRILSVERNRALVPHRESDGFAWLRAKTNTPEWMGG